MVNILPKIWHTASTARLSRALTSIDNLEEMQGFLRDVLTEAEIIEISARLEAARMLTAGAKYTDITKTTRLSSRTIARISDWLKNGTGGYAIALEASEEHTPPSRLRKISPKRF
jgi:TrpR-related protein YerC/YecD